MISSRGLAPLNTLVFLLLVEKTFGQYWCLKKKIFLACNCILGNTKYQSEILKLTLHESYTLPLLQYGAMAITRVVYFAFTAVWRYGSQIYKEDLNVCWNLVYHMIFGFNKFNSVRCFIAGLGRLDFCHLHLFLSLRFI